MKRILFAIAALLSATTSLAQYVNVYKTNGEVLQLSATEIDSITYTVKTDTVAEKENTINGYEYVDLGLSVKWATCNVGASSPEGYGNHYAWGETTPKASYTEYNSKTYGVSMSDISGNAAYDAATANWGAPWRLPTYEECCELLDFCTKEWTTYKGVKGYKVTGPNGNSIFLPAAGWRYGSDLNSAGSYGNYWSSTPHESIDGRAYNLYFDSSGSDWYYGVRYNGRSVRPVSE